jgi:cytochrome c-type biogenesis protein CcmH/NrfG
VRHMIRYAVLWQLALGLHAEAAPKWTQLQSENFLFIGDASEGQIRRVAERLEQFRDALLRVLPGASPHSPVPTVVMVFDLDRSMTPVKPLFRGTPIEVAGYFVSGEDVNYIAVNAEHLELAVPMVFHEYTHFLINESQGRVPVWVGEGLAELYEMTEQLDGGKSVVIGRAPAHHVALLQSSTMMPIKELVAVDQSASVYNEGNRRSLLYAQSWALVHYLTLGNRTRGGQFRDYQSAMQSGAAHEEAFAAAFGDAASLDRELFEYVRQFTFPAVRIGFPEKSAATSVPRGKALDDDEADAYLADMQARVSRVDEARKRVAAIQKRDPKVGRAFMVLGAIDLRENRLSDAVAHLEIAAALAPDDFIVQSAYGRSLVMQMSEVRNDPDRAAKILPQARRALVRATTINPGSARAAWMLAYAELAGGGDVPVAVGALTRAIELDPRREEYRILLAQALVRQGEYEKATDLLGPLMASGRTTEVRTEARRVLSDLANMRAARANGAATPPITTSVAASTGTFAPVPPRVSTASPVDAARLVEIRREGDRASGLLLRVVQPGEQRVLGTLDAIDCVNGTVVIRVTSNGRTLAFRARQLADVDFISYRSSTPGKVNCGPQKSRDRVYATYRPDAVAGGIDGLVVAIEVLPDDFVPPNPPR